MRQDELLRWTSQLQYTPGSDLRMRTIGLTVVVMAALCGEAAAAETAPPRTTL